MAAESSNSSSDSVTETTTTALHIGNLDTSVTEEELLRLFEQIGEVDSVKICMDDHHSSLGYGYVNFKFSAHAAKAIEELNFTLLKERRIRVSYSNRDTRSRKTGAGNVFVKNLDEKVDDEILHSVFSQFGTIVSAKVETDKSGKSRGYGFVQYTTEKSARLAVDDLNGALINEQNIYVAPFMSKEERDQATDKSKFTNVFVKNLSESTNEEDLKTAFGEYGPITSLVLIQDDDGKSKCFGFVNFENFEDAAKSVQGLNGKVFDDKEWYVGRAQKKWERERELKLQKSKSPASNLYVKNLDDRINEEMLKLLFSPIGCVKSCKLMCDERGISKGCGFVTFSNNQEASNAISKMNGKMVHGKPIYVAIAEKKDDRKTRLQSLFNSPRAISPTFSPPPMTPFVRQNIVNGYAPPAIHPLAMARFGYSQQLIPCLRPFATTYPFANGLSNITRPAGGYSGFNYMQPKQFRAPMMNHPQMLFRGNMNQFVVPNTEVCTPRGSGNWASSLSNSSPNTQRKMLGEKLLPLVKELEHEMASKVTSMILDMDHTEILHLIESPQSLEAKVAEAMRLLTKPNSTTGV
ncbi:hypothetical protein ABFS82_14G107700 [Erythranthe guttata]